MKKLVVLFSVLLTIQLFSQVPDPAFNPMTANGARHIHWYNNQWGHHILYWQNPANVVYNDVYLSQDSNLVINLDPAVKVLSGFDSSKTFSSFSLELLGILDLHTKYYWRVIEYNSNGSSVGPVWYFISQSSPYSYWDDDFSNGLINYSIIQPSGASWQISNTNNSGGFAAPELLFNSSPGFVGTSYLILDEIFDLSPTLNTIGFNYSFDWQAGEFTIGIAYSLDEGLTWTSIWQQLVTQDIPAAQFWLQAPNENYVKLALFCSSSISNSLGGWYLDNLGIATPLTISTPPHQIVASASDSSIKVNLSWSSGSTVNPSWGYVIQRKTGLPTSSSNYSQIAWVGPNVFSLEDFYVQLDSIYTYRIQTREGPSGGFKTAWGNEATAYLPAVVPVELFSFSSSVIENDVTLNWTTATETNNSGFEIERNVISNEVRNLSWKKIGFTNGHGTTTEPQTYYYKDENLSVGKYQYRLKQIDFDGTIEYSKIVEVEILPPAKFSLEQNYPNPFNPVTTIRYSIPNVTLSPDKIGIRSRVLLKVFDVLGNEVATLVNEFKPAGKYEIEFSAADGANKLSSGVYYYQLKAGSFVQTKKMILLK